MRGFSFIYLILLLLLLSCSGGQSPQTRQQGDTLKLKYAQNIQIIDYKDFKKVELKGPWNKDKILHTYILIERGKEPKQPLPEATIVYTPIKRAVIATSVHSGLVISFGKEENIKGVCDLKYIDIPYIQQAYNEGKIANCGNGITPMLEKIIEIDADALLISPFQNNGGYGRLSKWGRPIIETADYMEPSALGRAEWMKFYGMLFGAEKEADSIFLRVDKRYGELKEIAKSSKIKKSVIFDRVTSSVWYVPGGNSTIGRIVLDAFSYYSYSDNKNSGSIPLPFESVLEKAGDADIWMFRYNSPNEITYKTLLSEYPGYAFLKAFKEKNSYGCNTRKNRFYEDTPFHPDTLLRDFIIITHPDITSLGEPRYFLKVNE